MKIPPEPFTMAEFIEVNKLEVSPHDIPAVKIITEALIKKGYERIRRRRKGDVEVVWQDKKRLEKLRDMLK